MIRANTQNFTFAQLADLRNVFSGRCDTPNSAAVVNAFKSNLGEQYRPSRATVCTSGASIIGPHVATEDDLHILVDELMVYMAQAGITEPVVIDFELREMRGQVVVNGDEDARYSTSMVDKAVLAMRANAEIMKQSIALQCYDHIHDSDNGSLVLRGANDAYTLTYGANCMWALRLFRDLWSCLERRNVLGIREFTTLAEALDHLGPEI